MTEWKQERPTWCPHEGCGFAARSQDAICVGHLPEPVPHAGDENDQRLCLRQQPEGIALFTMEMNSSDVYHLRRMLEALHPDPAEERIRALYHQGDIACPCGCHLWGVCEKAVIAALRGGD